MLLVDRTKYPVVYLGVADGCSMVQRHTFLVELRGKEDGKVKTCAPLDIVELEMSPQKWMMLSTVISAV